MVAAGEQLATTFNELSAQLSTFATQAGEEYNSLTGPSGEVEDYANQLAQLNGQIKLAEEAGQPPNDMLDRRDLLLDKLSGLANVTVTEEPDHTDTVTFGEAAKPLVEGTTVNWPQTLTESSGGRLGALIQLTGPNGALTALQEGLDEVAGTLSSTVNGHLHQSVLLRRNSRDARRGRHSRRSPGLRQRSLGRQRSGTGNRRAARRCR